MKSLRPWLTLLAAAAGCTGDLNEFACNGDESCSGEVCIDHACAVTDTGCPSSYRWDSTSGPRSGQCAVAPDLQMLIDLGDPNCGNGKIDPNETCDPATGSPQLCPTAATCVAGDPCLNVKIVGSGCQAVCANLPAVADGKSCPANDGGVVGVCYNQLCCTGCWNGVKCESGRVPGACGGAGASCAACPATECNAGSCSMAGDCQLLPLTDSTPCATGGGACLAGSCCTGCVQSGACLTGDDDKACGTDGNSCSDCMAQNSTCGQVNGVNRCVGCTPQCLGKACGADNCGGSCGTCAQNKMCQGNQCVCTGNSEGSDALCSDGIDNDCDGHTDCGDSGCDAMRCSNSGGSFCQKGSCTDGCVINGTFYSPGTVNPNNRCEECDPQNDDGDWSDNTAPCAGDMTSGQCCGGACCIGGCCDGVGTCQISSKSHCGTSGACIDCNDSNDCTDDSCPAGDCINKARDDGKPCSGSCVMGCLNCDGRCFNTGVCTAGKCGQVHSACCPVNDVCDDSSGVAQCN